MTGVPLERPASDAPASGDGTPPARGRGRRRLRRLGQGLALAVVLGVPWWGRAGLRRLDFFRVRAVEVTGTRYLEPAEIVRRLGVDTLRSIWDELAPLERRVLEHPGVRAATVERGLPGTLRVRVEERLPVAFVPAPTGLRVVDDGGRVLPIDPSRRQVDVPIAPAADTAVLRLLGELREGAPAFYRQVSEVRRAGRDEIVFRLPGASVRARPTVEARRLADIRFVEADLARRRLRAAELDLRFRDQVIARLP
jgi:cell division protein FtsQ